MNKVVREHYPVSNLPEDLREQFVGVETVTITANAKHIGAGTDSHSSDNYERQYEAMMSSIKAMTLKELLADRQAHPEKYRGNVTPEEAVARIRALRDEWDSDR